MDNAYEAALDQHKNPTKSIRESGIDTGGKEHIYRHPRTYGQRAVFSIDGLYPTVRGTIRKMPPSKAFHAKDSSKNAAEILVPDWEFLAKIQSFPATFKWLPRNNADLVGNAVPPKFSAVLATIFSSRKRAVPE
jgi:DNA (cytosine-5)-methyltransferase 1